MNKEIRGYVRESLSLDQTQSPASPQTTFLAGEADCFSIHSSVDTSVMKFTAPLCNDYQLVGDAQISNYHMTLIL